MSLVALQHVGSSRTRAQTHVPCIGRQILNHCATREVPENVKFLLIKRMRNRKQWSKLLVRWFSRENSKHQREATLLNTRKCSGDCAIISSSGTHSRIYMESQGTSNSQDRLEKEDERWRTHTSDFKPYYKAAVINVMLAEGQTHQTNGAEQRIQKKTHVWSSDFWQGHRHNSFLSLRVLMRFSPHKRVSTVSSQPSTNRSYTHGCDDPVSILLVDGILPGGKNQTSASLPLPSCRTHSSAHAKWPVNEWMSKWVNEWMSYCPGGAPRGGAVQVNYPWCNRGRSASRIPSRQLAVCPAGSLGPQGTETSQATLKPKAFCKKKRKRSPLASVLDFTDVCFSQSSHDLW